MCPLSQDFVREVLNADHGFPDPSVAVDSFPLSLPVSGADGTKTLTSQGCEQLWE
jgi:hypothetical protein